MANKMDSPCSELGIVKIAAKIENWKELAPYLSISPSQQKEICNNDPQDYVLQKRAMLQKWKQRLGNKATYRKLKECFSSADRQDLADGVDEFFRNCRSQSPHDAKVEAGSKRRRKDPETPKDGKVEAGSKRTLKDPKTPKQTKKLKGDQEMPKESSVGSVSLASSSSSVVLHESETSDTGLAIGQLAIIKQELPDFTQWHNLGLSLGLTPGKLEAIEKNYRRTDEYLDEVLKNWLRRNYLKGYDPPTWNCLVKALAPIDRALADTIAKKHCKM